VLAPETDPVNNPPTRYSRVEIAVVRGATVFMVSLLEEIVSVTPSIVLVAGGLEGILPSATATGAAAGAPSAAGGGPGAATAIWAASAAGTGGAPPGSAGTGSADTGTANASNAVTAIAAAPNWNIPVPLRYMAIAA
jgi:hypothetical protein